MAVSPPPRIGPFLARLAEHPPQVLLLEGGNARMREDAAFHWALLLNCEAGAETSSGPSLLGDAALTPARPCGTCPGCAAFLARAHPDLFLLDGKEGTIKIDAVREIRSVLGEAPRGKGYRVVILAEAQQLTTEAANGLLKSLEEPRQRTSFLLLAPQRERLLPTLVSRSFVLTLPWRLPGAGMVPDTDGADEQEREAELQAWLTALAAFLTTGRGWFARTSAKGAASKELAFALVTRAQAELVSALRGEPAGELAQLFAQLSPQGCRAVDETLDKALTGLLSGAGAGTNPALTLDWLATRLRPLR